jgi:hypothetical protein
MNKALLVLALAVAMLVPAGASADGRGRVVVVHPYVYGRYAPFGGPYWGQYWGPYWDPYWGPYFAPDPYAGLGEVKLDTKLKDAQVYVNDGYLGTTGDNKTIHLRPGRYKIEVRVEGRAPFAANVYVTAGKTLHVKPEL